MRHAHLLAAVFYLVTWQVTDRIPAPCPKAEPPVDEYLGAPRVENPLLVPAIGCINFTTSVRSMRKEFEKKADAEAFIKGAWCKDQSGYTGGFTSSTCGDFRLEEIHE